MHQCDRRRGLHGIQHHGNGERQAVRGAREPPDHACAEHIAVRLARGEDHVRTIPTPVGQRRLTLQPGGRHDEQLADLRGAKADVDHLEAGARGPEARHAVFRRAAEAFLAACPLHVARWGFDLAPCAGVQIGALRAGGFGFDLSRQQEQLVLDATLGADLRRRLVGPLFAAAYVEMIVPLVRDRFFYLTAGGVKNEVFRMSPVAGSANLALGVELP